MIQGKEKILLLSGHMGSGKDTTGVPLARMLWPNTPVVKMAYADALREEITQILDAIRAKHDPIDTASLMECDQEQLSIMSRILKPALNENPSLTAWDHTPETRQALQYWGTGVRRAMNPDYWVNKTEISIRRELDQSHAVVITDGRFPNEADLIYRMNGILVRLDITPEEQDKRIFKRDGVHPSTEALSHPSETSIDDYPYYDARIQVDGLTLNEVMATCIDQLR